MLRNLLGDGATVARRFYHDQGLVLAAAVSFTFLLCLAPLTLLVFSAAGFLLESDEIAEYLFDSVTLLLPAYGHEVGEFLTLLTRERAVTGLVGAIGLMIFATQFFSMLRSVMNHAFRVPGRGVLHGLTYDLLALVLLVVTVVGFSLAVILLVALGDLALFLVPLPRPWSLPVRKTVTLGALSATAVAFVFLAYRALPNTRVSLRVAGTATAAVVLLWEAARRLFEAYIALFGVYGKLYGSFGIGVATLVWIYYSAVLLVLGAELAAALTDGSIGPLWRRRRRQDPPVDAT